MKRSLIALLGLVLMVGGLGAESAAQSLKSLGLAVAHAPVEPIEFELASIKGAKIKLSSLKGKIVLLNFWATWCGPCRKEMPSMQRMYDKLKSEGLEILAVDLMEDKRQVEGFAKELGLSFPILLDSDGKVGALYDARSIPTTYLLDRRGLLFSRAIGALEWDTPEMLKLLRRILRDGIGF